MKTLSGLGATESAYRFALDRLQTLTAQSAAVEVHTLSHYDTKSDLLAVSDGGGKIWVRERGGEWQRGLKGGRGLIFFTDDDSGSWEPEFARDSFLRFSVGKERESRPPSASPAACSWDLASKRRTCAPTVRTLSSRR